jgi:hypothetical protein
MNRWWQGMTHGRFEKQRSAEFCGARLQEDEDTNHLAILTDLIRDVDIGVQKDALLLVKTVTRAYKAQLNPEIYDIWFDSLVQDIPANKPDMTGLLLHALSE